MNASIRLSVHGSKKLLVMSLLIVVGILGSNITFEVAKKLRMILMRFVGHISHLSILQIYP
jgi:hypothetical protein